eukprot:TRINITY_DN2941_c0_g1_i1.p1 TRINITY_DN2941_c0_g1~~TRINITY_DN2941_c0_g1_i1.p1  ORF type:complete len:502 (-),score=151.53 TRINITY_DN2941_c0_g1_i1:45-1550(-)
MERFGDLPLNQSQTRSEKVWTSLSEINEASAGQRLNIRCRIHRVRGKGKSCFLVLRDQFYTIQGCAFAGDDTPRELIKYMQKLTSETLVDVTADVVAVDQPTTCTISTLELQIYSCHSVSRASNQLPFQLEDAARSPQEIERMIAEGKQVAEVFTKTRLDNRIMDLRVPANLAIFRGQSMFGLLFREFLISRNFIEIHSPKIIGGASEGGSSVFELTYFGNQAALAQSPQLYKQMAICSDFGRVFEIGPVFRAEQSLTHRHLCEFVGLDIEMAFNEHYHEVLELLGEMLVFILSEFEKRAATEIDTIRKQYPSRPFALPEKCPIFTYEEVIGWLNEDTEKLLSQPEVVKTFTKEEAESVVVLNPLEDINTVNEKRLGRVIFEKFGTDLYIVDKFPVAARPFYTMPDPSRPGYTNSYDIFLRGEEICSGAQRIHDVEMLTIRAEECGIPLNTLSGYLEAFKYGTSPHAGCGIGLERLTMLYLGLDNIRKTSLFPRDPHRLSP